MTEPDGMRPVRVLIVDDDPDDALVTRKLLGQVGGRPVEVSTADGPTAAFALLAEGQFDLCLLDYWLGAVTGIEVMATMAARRVEVPVILLTGNEDRAADEAAERHGAYDYIPKNAVTAETLERAVRYALSRRRLEMQLAAAAFYDPLTGLANRRLFEDHIARAAERCWRQGGRLCFLYVDLNEFKPINDRFGHDAGDQVLKAFAERLARTIRHGDLAARVGGDEFAIALEIGQPGCDPAQLTARLVAALAPPVQIAGISMTINASIGVAVLPDDSQDVRDVVRLADMAMYRAKQICRRTGRTAVVHHGAPADPASTD